MEEIKKLIHKLYEASIEEISAIEDLSIEYDMLDSQEYLNWKDALNSLSIDLDRKQATLN